MPVMKPRPGLARKAISSPTSSGGRAGRAAPCAATPRAPRARSRRGPRCRSARSSRRPSGSRSGSTPAPGPQARFSSAARAALACANPGIPRRGEKPMKTTSPPSPGIIERFATWLVRSQTPSTLSRWTARQPFERDLLRAGPRTGRPALLTSTSIRAEALEHRLDQPVDLVGLADVAGQRQALGARRLELVPDPLERLGPAAADRHPGAGRRQGVRGRAPDPGPPAGDERDLAGVRVRRRTRLIGPARPAPGPRRRPAALLGLLGRIDARQRRDAAVAEHLVALTRPAPPRSRRRSPSPRARRAAPRPATRRASSRAAAISSLGLDDAVDQAPARRLRRRRSAPRSAASPSPARAACRFGSRSTPPASATKPRLTSGSEKRRPRPRRSVAGERELEAAAGRVAVDRGDHRLVEVEELGQAGEPAGARSPRDRRPPRPSGPSRRRRSARPPPVMIATRSSGSSRKATNARPAPGWWPSRSRSRAGVQPDSRIGPSRSTSTRASEHPTRPPRPRVGAAPAGGWSEAAPVLASQPVSSGTRTARGEEPRGAATTRAAEGST